MLVSHKHNIVIFTPERTASTSIHFSLKKYFDVSFEHIEIFNFPCKHVTAEVFEKLIEPFLEKSYYKISVFRNPIDRCISIYKMIINMKMFANLTDPQKVSVKNQSFDDWWMENTANIWLSQTQVLSANNQIYVDRLFDFNQLNLFCNFISDVLETDIKLPHHNKFFDESDIQISDYTYNSMNSFFAKDNELYKSIVDAGGELIINPYHPTP
jgi:hypothetical protein